MYRLYIIKRCIEDIMLLPFILTGKLIAGLFPLKKEYDIFFFFPFYHVGGAEKVHAQVAKALGDERCIIFFTRRSHNDLFYNHFLETKCDIRDISRYTDNKFLYFLNLVYRGIIAHYINRQRQQPVVFNGQCNFGYKISPWIHRGIPQIELIHSFNSFSWIRLPFLPFITRTVMISQLRIRDHIQQYRRLGVPEKYGQRIQYIINGIDLPPQVANRSYTGDSLRVLYAGRATPEKRVHIVAQIAEKIHGFDKSITFAFLGDVQEAIPPGLHSYGEFYGYQTDAKEIAAIYDRSDILMIVSNTEGFPMVVMEAMANGCAIIATPVGDIPLHVQHNINGFLFSSVNNEPEIVQEGVEYVLKLKTNPQLLQQMATQNIQYARAHFGIDQFNRTYIELVNSLKVTSR